MNIKIHFPCHRPPCLWVRTGLLTRQPGSVATIIAESCDSSAWCAWRASCCTTDLGLLWLFPRLLANQSRCSRVLCSWHSWWSRLGGLGPIILRRGLAVAQWRSALWARPIQCGGKLCDGAAEGSRYRGDSYTWCRLCRGTAGLGLPV